MKPLKFDPKLVPLVLSGEKTSTWRLFDDKNLQIGDDLILINKETGEEFARAVILNTREKKFKDLEENDLEGHEKFESRQKMHEAYNSYYGDRVTLDTIVKIINFKINTMKLFLTSTGLSNSKIIEEFLRILKRSPEDTRALVVAYGQNDIERFYIDEARKQVENTGVNVTVLNMQDSFRIEDLPDFDVVYVCGGNTFSILKKMRETKIDGFIRSQVGRGSIYVGVSAGSIIAGPNIEIAGWGIDGDKNEVELKDLEGFSFTNIAVLPHFENSKHQEEVNEFKKKVDYPVQEITDEQVLIIFDSSKILI